MKQVVWKIALVAAPLATAVLSALFLASFIISFTEMSTLEAGSVETQAQVTGSRKGQPSVKNISPIQITSIEYSFQVNDQTYVDSALGIDKIGDTLSILYAKDNPTISIPARINVSEQKTFSGLAAVLTFLVGMGLTIVVARIMWRKVASKDAQAKITIKRMRK